MLNLQVIVARISLLLLFSMWIGLLGINSKYSILLYIFYSLLSYTTGYLLLKNISNANILNIKIFNLKIFLYVFWLVSEIIKSTCIVIKIIIFKTKDIEPEFIWIDSKQDNDLGLIAFANSITLTPGTITVDIKDNLLLVHALDKSLLDGLEDGEMSRKVQLIT